MRSRFSEAKKKLRAVAILKKVRYNLREYTLNKEVYSIAKLIRKELSPFKWWKYKHVWKLKNKLSSG